jgi:hypothetical protein
METVPSILSLHDRPLSRYELVDRGDLVIFPYLRPCRVSILIVVDASISFSHAYFGLSAVLDTLRNNPEFYVKFDVTRAHRQTDNFKPNQATEPVAWSRYGPHFESFRFTQPGFNIDNYNQIWFFGFYGEGGAGALSAAELEILSRWMDRGGGVFATGDHADLGAALCSQIPRVRSMRKWTNAQGVPMPNGSNRHDTLRKGLNASYTFDDESDDEPMPITPIYENLGSWSPYLERRAPHPLLCGKDGVIDILPDHPHEGEVLDGWQIDLTAKFGFGSYTNQPEYPTVSGHAEEPKLVARARIQSDHSATDFKGVVNAKSFGVIGAYDGHTVNVGRVAVDSTWHHWFDVNLIGRPVSNLDSSPMDATNPKIHGFNASVAGQHALARIQNYFRNVALWLAPKAKQNCMFTRATWGVVIRYPLIERLHPLLPIWELGGVARDAIGLRASQCTVSRWIFDIYIPKLVDIFKFRPDPCLSCPPFELVERYILGAITREMLTIAYELEKREKPDQEMDLKPVQEAFVRGVEIGTKELVTALNRSLEDGRKLVEELAPLLEQNRIKDFSFEDKSEGEKPKRKKK